MNATASTAGAKSASRTAAVRKKSMRRSSAKCLAGDCYFSRLLTNMRSLHGFKTTLALVLSVASLLRQAGGTLEKNDEQPAKLLSVDVNLSQDRQVIEGFGGSLAFWGFEPSDQALRYAFDDLGAT